jgi:AP2 domain./HNH endonuclease.
MKEIPLAQGKVALVSDHRYEYLNQWKWSYDNQYARRSTSIKGGKKQRTVFMHREIMSPPKGMEVDHIDGNKLNNQDDNLRVCTRSQNQQNKSVQNNNASGYKGVSKKRGKYMASIKLNGRIVYIGTFDTPEEAAHARDNKAKELHGEFAKLNFEE